MKQTFGERLRALRLRRDLTPGGLAQLVGVTEGAIRQIESGQTKSASFTTGVRLAHALGVSPWFLATGKDGQPETGSPGRDSLVEAVERLTVQVAAVDRRLRELEGQRPRGTRRKAGG